MANHEFSVGDVIKVRNGVELPPGYTVTCGEWVGVVKRLDGPGRVGVATLITRDCEWKEELEILVTNDYGGEREVILKEERYNSIYPVEERYFEIA